MSRSLPVIIGGAVGALVLVLIVSVVSLLFVFKRRQSRSDKEPPQQSAEYEDIDICLETLENQLQSKAVSSMNLMESKAVSSIPAPIGTSATPNSESTAAVKKHPTAAPNGAAILDENTYENSTRIAVESLQDLIRYEKEKFPDDPFKQEFLRLESANLKSDEGRTPENIFKNWFKGIAPFDENRVKLEVTSRHTSDYVNASYIKDFYKPDYYKFIAAQGPKEGTAVDMWRLIHDTRANTIVMLTNLVESGKKKCWQYWPSKVSESIEFEDYTVTLLEEQVYALHIVRKLSYTVNNIKRQTTLFHYTKWYDHDIPSSAGLLSFRSRVRQHYGSSTTPIIVHCSAGVGRTGTYIALENLIDEAHDKRNHHKTVDVFACVNRLRHQRTLMVQTADQYAFLYDMVSEALSCGDTVIPAALKENKLIIKRINFYKMKEAPALTTYNITNIIHESKNTYCIYYNEGRVSLQPAKTTPQSL
ncbi:hypothetical protein EB796_020138 [Bugula neritina]|uniref:Uncharacterized protein n=1 Tax=Bugula neritina TaxID=10212 RepID=A0A7J7J5V8_BUGNE|nr:hypothetical protein EB796_020138 [Bugula neritina]